MFKPSYFFFYGSSMDPEVLQYVLGLSELPVVQKSYVKGFMVKMMGTYPVFMPTDGQQVNGTISFVGSVDCFAKLSEYETDAYITCSLSIYRMDGEVIPDGQAFSWASDPESSDFENSEFDLERH